MTTFEFFKMENIHWLPVEPEKLIQRRKIPLYTYEQFSELTQDPLSALIQEYGPDGFSTTADGSPVIIYNKAQNPGRKRWTLMHELSHIVLGHLDQCGGMQAHRQARDRFDRHADFFTVNALAPLPVLGLCRANTESMIQRMTGLSREASRYRLQELADGSCTKWGFSSQTVRGYSEQFAEYIDYVIDGDFYADWDFDTEMEYLLRPSRKKNQPTKPRPMRHCTYYLPRRPAPQPYVPSKAEQERFDRLEEEYYDALFEEWYGEK